MTATAARRLDRPAATEDPYRAFVTFDAEKDVLDRIHDQLATWLGEKRWDVDPSRGGLYQADGNDLVIVTHAESGAHHLRARLTERKPDGIWRTELTVHAPERGEGWLLLDVANDRQRFVSVPRLAKYLLAAIDVRDGAELALTDTARAVSMAQVQELAEAVTDPHRNGLIFVAGTDEFGIDFDVFLAQVKRWTKEVVGQAETVVLDPHATREFSDIMENTHGVHPWTIRTYLPDVDPAVESDALRHRFLTTQRLATAPEREIVRLLARVARRQSANRALPPVVARVMRTLGRIENGYLIDAVTHAPHEPIVEAKPAPEKTRPDVTPVADQATRYLAEVEMVKAVFGLAALDEATLRDIARRSSSAVEPAALDRVTRQLQEQQDRIAELREKLDAVTAALEEEELEHAITDEERTGSRTRTGTCAGDSRRRRTGRRPLRRHRTRRSRSTRRPIWS